MIIYTVQNSNPTVGPVRGETQTISVYDRDLGNRRTIISTPEEVDEFVSARKRAMNKASNEGLGIMAGMTALGGAAGAAINSYLENNKANKINNLVDKLNVDYKEAIKDYKKGSTWSIINELLEKENYKNAASKLRNLFSNKENLFKKIDLKTIAKPALKYGALFGAAIGIGIGMFAPGAKVENADKKITQAFIEDNK